MKKVKYEMKLQNTMSNNNGVVNIRHESRVKSVGSAH